MVRVLSILFVLSLPLLLITTTASLAINQVRLYEYDFDHYGISERTGIERSELVKAAKGLIHYLNSDQASAEIMVIKQGQPFRLFNQKELDHLRDVKSLVRLVHSIYLATMVYTATYLAFGLWVWRQRFWGELRKAVIAGSLLTLAIIGVLGVAALFDFTALFLEFHFLSFTNNLWQLDPTKDYLLMMFPEGFFRDATLFIASGVVAEALFLGGLSGWREVRARKLRKRAAKEAE